jgi:hypothetical protein
MLTRVEGSMPTHSNTWMTVEQAATFLNLPPVTLRRAFERHARATSEGGTVAQIDGITARKLGRLWRVWLDPSWHTPTAPK